MRAFQCGWIIKLFMCNSILTVCIFCHIKTRVTKDTKDTLNSRAGFHIMLCFTQDSEAHQDGYVSLPRGPET